MPPSTVIVVNSPHPLVILQLSGVRTFKEAAKVWADEAVPLSGATFVLSVPETCNVRWPAKVDLPGGGYLRSIFAHDKLLFVNEEILDSMSREAAVTLPVDYSIGFDSNVAQYLSNLVEGTHVTQPAIIGFRKTLQTLAQGRMNWELMPFLVEHSEAARTGRHADRLWRTVRASEYFDRCDLHHFRTSGELRLCASEEEVNAATQRAISDWCRVVSADALSNYHAQHRLIQVLLLKAALLRHNRPGIDAAGRNLAEFLEFMCAVVQCSLPWMLWAAAGLFEQGGQFEPLRKLTCAPANFPERSRNIAWDVVHYMVRRDFARGIGRDSAFMVPYTLTFDRGLAEFFDGQPQRSCLILPDGGMPRFFADRNIEGDVLSRHPGIVDVAAQHLTMNAHTARTERYKTTGRPDLSPILSALIEDCERA